MSEADSVTLKFNIKLTLLFAVLMPLLLSLGFWQLDRAEKKQTMLKSFSQAKKKSATLWHRDNLENYRLVEVEGEFDQEKYWLLDNRVKQGKVGFDVIMPFYSSGQTLMVNRGWVKGDISRKRLPEFNTPAGRIKIVGRVYLPQTDKPSFTNTESWPKIIGFINTQEMSGHIKQPDPKGILRLQGDSQGALQTGWPEVNVSVAKHQGYALQWFVMSLACLVLYLVYGSNLFTWIKNNNNN